MTLSHGQKSFILFVVAVALLSIVWGTIGVATDGSQTEGQKRVLLYTQCIAGTTRERTIDCATILNWPTT